MNTRTFRGSTMIEALQAVQKELGSDAIVVSMREMEAGLWHKPGFEIVAAKPSVRKPPMKAALPNPAPVEPRLEPKTTPVRSDPALKANLAAAIQAVTKKYPTAEIEIEVEEEPAAPAKPARQPSRTAGTMAKEARPFIPEVLSKRVSTRTWLVTDEDAREDVRPAVIEKLTPSPLKNNRREALPMVSAGKRETPPLAAPIMPATWEREDHREEHLAATVQAEAVKPAVVDDVEETEALARLRTHLLNQGLDASLVERLNQVCAGALSPNRLADVGYVSNFLKKQLAANLRPAIKIVGEGHRVICLIGTSGAGKTSACAKLAAYFSLQEGLKVAWIEANTTRTGAIAEARMITESIGVDLHLVYGPEDLADALANTQDADLVLMDTAGCNPRREASLVELGELITSLPHRMTLLVTSATTKDADLKQSLAAFSPFTLDGLVVTHMDETLTFGSIYNQACQSRLPVAYYTSDPAAMNGLSVGGGEVLVNALFNEGI